MECLRCGSQNMKTFEMAYASHNVGISSWSGFAKFMLFGYLGFFIKPNRNSVAGITSPPEKPFPVLAVVFSFLFIAPLVFFISSYLRRGLDYGGTQDALLVSAIMLVIAALTVSWDIIRCAKARKKYPVLLDKWIHSWICLQCGTTYEVRDLPRA